ncbi:hypothetical protein AB0A76_28950 [Streptomyces exfoliatus]|uniref:SMI1/KNR4 family protein n=1 Tax=Streptomyces exfoliatus TaxID=1905 RepID=A0ABV3D3V5_STREX
MNGDETGVQAPVVRWGDPYEALAALEGAVPGLLALRGGAAGRVDWAVVERGLGTALPGDFKLLAESYPPLLFGDYLSFWTPRPGAEEAWDWWHYDAGAVQFTADLISGALQPWGLPPVRPEVVAVGGGTGGEA